MNWVRIQLKAFLRSLWKSFLYKIVFRSTPANGEYFRNQFGSIISPLEHKIAWDSHLTQRAFLLNGFLKPATAISKNLSLTRLGSIGDGGYYLPETYIYCDGVISGGISNNNDFEFDLASRSIPVVQFDHSIVEPPIKDKLLFFRKNKLGNEGLSLNETINIFNEATGKNIKNGILKLDIEGSEFDFLAAATVQDLANFDIVVMELHYLGNIYQDFFWEKVQKSLSLICRNHKPIIVVGNNSRSFVQIGGVPIYDIVEITFIRKNAEVPFFDSREAITEQIAGRAALRIS
jgi:hypothetical protein